MGSILNETIAARLQYLTFPLELIGLTLALIEVRFPRAAAWVTRQIERLASPIEELRSGESGSETTLERSLAALLTRVLRTGFFALTALYVVRAVYLLTDRGPELSWIVGLLISYVIAGITVTVTLVVLGVTAFFLVVGGSDFVRRFVAGRAIGTLGILIAGLGLLGEFYQFLAQLLL